MSKILTFLTNLGNTFKALAPAFKAAVVIAILVVLYFTFAATDKPDSITAFNAKYGPYTASVDSVLKFVKDSSAKEVTAHQHVAQAALAKIDQQQSYIVKLQKTTPSKDSLARLERQIDSLKKATTDSVVLARTVIPKMDTLIATQDTALAKKDSSIVDYINQVGLFHTAVIQKDSIIGVQKIDIDTLSDKLLHLPKAPTSNNKFLGFIPMPDRKTAAAWGFGAGVLATIELFIHVK